MADMRPAGELADAPHTCTICAHPYWPDTDDRGLCGRCAAVVLNG